MALVAPIGIMAPVALVASVPKVAPMAIEASVATADSVSSATSLSSASKDLLGVSSEEKEVKLSRQKFLLRLSLRKGTSKSLLAITESTASSKESGRSLLNESLCNREEEEKGEEEEALNGTKG